MTLLAGGVQLSSLTVVLDYCLVAILLFMATKSFRAVLKTDENQLRTVFQARAPPLITMDTHTQSRSEFGTPVKSVDCDAEKRSRHENELKLSC